MKKERGGSRLPAAPEEGPRLRFRASGFATLRKKLGLTAKQMGLLVGVSALTVYKWEHGTSKPRAKQLSAIAATRSLGKREAMAQLETVQAKATASRPRTRK